MAKNFESKPNKYDVRIDPALEQREEKRKLFKKIGIGAAGVAALGIAASIGTGEKKSQEDLSQKLSSPTKREVVHRVPDASGTFPSLSDRRVTPEQLQAIRARLAPKERVTEEIVEKKSREEASEVELVKDTKFYAEMAVSNPENLLRNHLAELKGLPDAKVILSSTNVYASENPAAGALIFEALPKIRMLGILSEREFFAFVTEVIEKHPTVYLTSLGLNNASDYIPKNKDIVLAAIENDLPFVVGLPSYMGKLKTLVGETVKSYGDSSLRQVYEVFTDERYTREEKGAVAVLYPLIKQGSITVDEAARMVSDNPMMYWQRVAQIADLTPEGVSTPATRELKIWANQLIKNGDPNGSEVQAIEDTWSAAEIQALVTYATAPSGQMGDMYKRLLEILQNKWQR